MNDVNGGRDRLPAFGSSHSTDSTDRWIGRLIGGLVGLALGLVGGIVIMSVGAGSATCISDTCLTYPTSIAKASVAATASLAFFVVAGVGFALRTQTLRRAAALRGLVWILVTTLVIATLVWASKSPTDRDASRVLLEVLGSITAATLLFTFILEAYQLQMRREAADQRRHRVETVLKRVQTDVAGPLFERAWHVLCDVVLEDDLNETDKADQIMTNLRGAFNAPARLLDGGRQDIQDRLMLISQLKGADDRNPLQGLSIRANDYATAVLAINADHERVDTLLESVQSLRDLRDRLARWDPVDVREQRLFAISVLKNAWIDPSEERIDLLMVDLWHGTISIESAYGPTDEEWQQALSYDLRMFTSAWVAVAEMYRLLLDLPVIHANDDREDPVSDSDTPWRSLSACG